MLVQYTQPLIEHIRNAWVLAPILPNHFVTVVPPQMRAGPEWFQGTAATRYRASERGVAVVPMAAVRPDTHRYE